MLLLELDRIIIFLRLFLQKSVDKESIAQVEGRGLIIGPGCVVNQFVTEEKLRAVQRALVL